ENAELRVPGASDGVGEPFAERDSVKSVAFHSVVRGDGAETDLDDDECGNDPEIFLDGFHRRRGFQREQWIAFGKFHFFFVAFVVALHGEIPNQRADAAEERYEADD